MKSNTIESMAANILAIAALFVVSLFSVDVWAAQKTIDYTAGSGSLSDVRDGANGIANVSLDTAGDLTFVLDAGTASTFTDFDDWFFSPGNGTISSTLLNNVYYADPSRGVKLYEVAGTNFSFDAVTFYQVVQTLGHHSIILTGYSNGSQTVTATITPPDGGVGDVFTLTRASNFNSALWQNVDAVTIEFPYDNPSNSIKYDARFAIANIVVDDATASNNSDGTLIAAGGVTEPINLPTTASGSGNKINVFDFTLVDGGGGDGLTLDVSQIDLTLGGTASANFSKLRFGLSGCATKSDIAPSGSTVSFTSTGISVTDGGNSTCTVSAYWNDNTGITDNQTVTISIDGDTDLTVDGAKTQMSGANAAVATGNMATTVSASKIAFTTTPTSGDTSGSAMTSFAVTAQDAAGNTDVDYSSNVVVSKNSGAGSLSGTTTVAASSGVATFNSVTYTATADGESYVLDADSGAFATITSGSLTSDVVATKLAFDTQPVPTTIDSGSSTDFTTDPVIQAVDANDILDTGYSTNIVLEVTDPSDGTVDGTVNSMSGTGDLDGDGTTVTLSPSSGAATFTGLALQYTNSGASESIALKATSGGLTTVNSSTLTSLVNNAPALANLDSDSVAWAGIGSTVTLDSGGDATASDTELDALNGSNGDYDGGSLT
ncbi:MAG: hypothetical protein P8144_02425, partial [Gammaproteobacteria bacterium]